jgi:hypothetical protein
MESGRTDYERILKENVRILQSTVPVEIQRTDSLYENEARELTNRGSLYTALLEAYVTDFDLRHSGNMGYKKAFFITVMSLFCISVLAACAALALIAARGAQGAGDIVAALCSMATIISSFVIIPRIIAEYLFPLDEDKKVTEIVGIMQQNDSATRKIHRDGQ